MQANIAIYSNSELRYCRKRIFIAQRPSWHKTNSIKPLNGCGMALNMWEGPKFCPSPQDLSSREWVCSNYIHLCSSALENFIQHKDSNVHTFTPVVTSISQYNSFLSVWNSKFVFKMRHFSNIWLQYCRDLEIWVRGHSRSLIMVPFDRLGIVSY